MKIRADILRTYQTLHTWTGIATGLLLFIGFFAGALVMFSDEIDQWASAPSEQLQQVSDEQKQQLLNAVLSSQPKAVDSVTLNYHSARSPITWQHAGDERTRVVDHQLWHGTLGEQGELITAISPVNHLSTLLDYLHQTGGIFGELGHHFIGGYVLGIAAFVYFIALVSGVIFLLPTLVKSFLALRDKKSVSRFWLDTHNLIGITSLPFHVVIAFTVFVFAFHDFLYDGLSVVYDDKPLFSREAPSKVAYETKQLPALSEIHSTVTNYAPGYQIESITLSRLNGTSPSASVRITNVQEMTRGPTSDFLFMHPYTLEVTGSSVRQGDQGVWVQIVATMFSLHYGSYGGLLGKWAYFVMGLMGALLFYTGNLLWIEKRRKQKHAAQSKSSTILASLTVGICLGCLFGISLVFAATKWLPVIGFNSNMAYMWLYYIGFFTVLLMAFKKGAAKAAILALRVCALACLIVPVNSLIALVLPSLGPWAAQGSVEVGIEVVALVFAWACYYSAKKVQLRANNGEPNSVWYIN